MCWMSNFLLPVIWWLVHLKSFITFLSLFISFSGLICTGSMLLFPVLLATSFWSCKPFFLSSLLPIYSEHTPGSKLQEFLPSCNFSAFTSRCRHAVSARANPRAAEPDEGHVCQHVMSTGEKSRCALVQAASQRATEEDILCVRRDACFWGQQR